MHFARRCTKTATYFLLSALHCALAAATVLQAAMGRVAAEPPKSSVVAPVAARFDLRIVGSDGNAVSRVQVDLASEPAFHAGQVRRGRFVKDASDWARIEADDEGRIVLERPAQWNRLDLSIEAPGCASYSAMWRPQLRSESIPAQYVVKLTAGWPVGGTIVDDRGKPVVGAKIRPAPSLSLDQSRLRRCLDQRPQSDGSGIWRFDSVPLWQDSVTVEIDHPNFMPKSLLLNRAEFEVARAQKPSARIVLDRGQTVVGKVTDTNGAGVAGALVQAYIVPYFQRTAVTDAEGNYRLVGCRPEAAMVMVTAKRLAPVWRPVWIQPEMKPADFQMARAATVRFRLLETRGNPIPKAALYFSPFSDFDSGRPSESTDEQGSWEWREGPREKFSVSITLPDGRRLNNQPLVTGQNEIRFRAPPDAQTISGRVIDARTKQPIKQFRVVPRLGPSWGWRESFIASDGNFWIRPTFPPGAGNQIRIEADGYLPLESDRIKNDKPNVAVNFALTPGADIEGSVLTADGRPCARARVALAIGGAFVTIKNGELADYQPGVEQRTTDDAGHFRFPREKTAYWLLVTHHTGFAQVQCSPASDPKPIRLTRWSRLKGTYYAAERPQPYLSLSVVFLNGLRGANKPYVNWNFTQFTDSKGRYEFDRLMPGPGSLGRPQILLNPLVEVGMSSYSSVPLQFQPGETTHFDLGASGRPVIGQLRQAADAKVKVPWSHAAIMVQAEDARLRASSPSFSATLAADGSFCIDGVPPGKYVLIVGADWMARPQPERPFTVSAVDKKLMQRPVDLGVLTLKAEKER